MKILRAFRRGLPWSLLWILLGLIALPIALALGLLLLIIFLVFCAGGIRYRINAKIGEDKTGSFEFSYFLRLIHIVATYVDGKLETRARIAWVRIGEKKPPKKKRRGKKAKPADTNSKTPPAKDANSAIQIDAARGHVTIKNGAANPPPNPEEKEEEKEKKDRFAVFRQIKAVLTYPERKIIMALVLRCLQKFLKALRPKKLDIHGIIGFDDPATTGWVMGSYEAFASLLNIRHMVRLLGSYHEKAFDLSIQAKGRTRLGRLMWPFVWLYLKKPIRRVIHKHIFRKGDSNE